MGMMRRAGRVVGVLHELGPKRGWRHQPGAAFPQGRLATDGGDGSDPRHGKEECDKHSLPGQFFDKERGVAPITQ